MIFKVVRLHQITKAAAVSEPEKRLRTELWDIQGGAISKQELEWEGSLEEN